MAKHNVVTLYGIVARKPKIFEHQEENKINTAYCPITVIRGTRDSAYDGLNDIRYDSPVILSNNPAIIANMRNWEENDMVEIKGVLTTKNITKRTLCPHCKTVHLEEGSMLTYVTPIYASIRETGITKDEGIRLLKKRAEISNSVTLLGTLRRDPDYFKTPSGVDITQYPLAVGRKYRVMGDDPTNTYDFPWIKSFNRVAKEDGKRLKNGALVLIDGMLQTREFQRVSTCKNCGADFQWLDTAVEVVVYSNEYLTGYKTQDEIDKEEAEKVKKIEDDLFDS